MPDYPIALLEIFAIVKVNIAALTEKLQRSEITLDEWHEDMQKIIAQAALAAMMLGLDSETLTAQAEQAVNEFVQGQQKFLDGFVSDIETGLSGGWQEQWNARAEMYGEAIQPLYWQGQTRFIKLPAYPGDCTSECLTSDRCMWFLDWIDEENLDVDAYWVNLKDKSVCPTCVRRGDNWYPLQIRNGIVPNVTD